MKSKSAEHYQEMAGDRYEDEKLYRVKRLLSVVETLHIWAPNKEEASELAENAAVGDVSLRETRVEDVIKVELELE